MRTIRRTAAFKRDYRREKKSRFARTLDAEFAHVVAGLARSRRAIATMRLAGNGRTTGTVTSGPTWS